MAIDTIFMCFCEDSEMNDGVEKPYFMSRGLMVCFENLITCRREITAYFTKLFSQQEYVSNSNQAIQAEKDRKRAKKQRRKGSTFSSRQRLV